MSVPSVSAGTVSTGRVELGTVEHGSMEQAFSAAFSSSEMPALAPAVTQPVRRPWRVVHAASSIAEVYRLVEAELAAGMRPQLITPCGQPALTALAEALRCEATPPLSLLNAWNEVRQWRQSLLTADPN